ncbi:Transmembrane protein 154 [Caenorhabditis elegans]|uniref:Transmembrane protein 154 n=1 Tax=Caenorhabditis elegans TaxID=6239 RepID=Q22652_CAEEL|nr:Transmembrane protein 154 [Caenorhabditis elegans]CCD71585.2 Transmembrane protein 154 [Caenorhabditis elegans]
MSRFQNVVVSCVLLVLLTIYCWIFKKKPERPENFFFAKTGMIPDLTFSKLADLENQMLTDFDNIALRSTNSNDELTPVPSTKYEILPIVMLISLSMSGIVIILILTRRRCLQDAESDCEKCSSTYILSSEEKLHRSYNTRDLPM